MNGPAGRPADNPSNSDRLGVEHQTVPELTVRVYWQPRPPIWERFGLYPDQDPKWRSGTVANTTLYHHLQVYLQSALDHSLQVYLPTCLIMAWKCIPKFTQLQLPSVYLKYTGLPASSVSSNFFGYSLPVYLSVYSISCNYISKSIGSWSQNSSISWHHRLEVYLQSCSIATCK